MEIWAALMIEYDNVRAALRFFEDKTSYFGHPLAALTWRLAEDSNPVVEGDDLQITLYREEGLDPGRYHITGVAANANYEAVFTEGIYTIVILPALMYLGIGAGVVILSVAALFLFRKRA